MTATLAPVLERLQPVTAALAGQRFPLEDEKRTQEAIGDALTRALGADWVVREYRLTSGIIDFVVVDHPGPGLIGIEVKIKGAPREIVRQLVRYAGEVQIAGLVLVTARPMRLPPTLQGKPVAMVDLGRAWL